MMRRTFLAMAMGVAIAHACRCRVVCAPGYAYTSQDCAPASPCVQVVPPEPLSGIDPSQPPIVAYFDWLDAYEGAFAALHGCDGECVMPVYYDLAAISGDCGAINAALAEVTAYELYYNAMNADADAVLSSMNQAGPGVPPSFASAVVAYMNTFCVTAAVTYLDALSEDLSYFNTNCVVPQ